MARFAAEKKIFADPRHANNSVKMGLDMISLIREVILFLQIYLCDYYSKEDIKA